MTEQITHSSSAQSFPSYAFEIFLDGTLAIVLGIFIDKLMDHIQKYFGLSFITIFVLQIILIIIVLYIMRTQSRYLYASWQGNTNYGILFIALFLSVQQNLTMVLGKIYGEEEA